MATEQRRGQLLYVHDHRFVRFQDGVYSRSAYPAGFWDKYFHVFDSVTVVGRDSPQGDLPRSAFVRSNRDGVSFTLLKGTGRRGSSLVLTRRLRTWLDERLPHASALIVRVPSRFASVAVRKAIKLGVPVGAEVSGCARDAYWNHGRLMAKLYAPFAYLRMRRVVRRARSVLYVTRRFLQNRYPASPGVPVFSASNVELPAVIDKIRPVVSPGVRLADKDRVVFGIIGNYRTGYKGIRDAIVALGGLKSQLPDFELRILGAGDAAPYRSVAESLGIRKNLVFSGVLPNGSAVLEWIDQVDVYLQPSRTEGLPRSLVEALSRGKLAVASTAGGMPELLGPEFLHRPSDARSLADRIQYVLALQEPMEYQEINRTTAIEYLSSDLAARRRGFLIALTGRGPE